MLPLLLGLEILAGAEAILPIFLERTISVDPAFFRPKAVEPEEIQDRIEGRPANHHQKNESANASSRVAGALDSPVLAPFAEEFPLTYCR